MPSTQQIKAYIVKVAADVGIPATFALAVAQFESGFRPDAVSSAGALGIFQLMPQTAQGLGFDPRKWRENVQAGITYLRNLHRQYGLDWHDTYAAYNYGPGNYQASGAQHNASTVLSYRSAYRSFVQRQEGSGGGRGNVTGPTVAQFIQAAKRQIGDPYVWGAEGPNGFDCSGLIWYAMTRAGVDIPRTTAAGFQSQTPNVNKANLKPGDLVFFNYGRLGPGTADHVGIYIGDGKMIAASSSADKVQIQSVDWANFIGGGRLEDLGRKGASQNWQGGNGPGGGAPGGFGHFGGPNISGGELAGILRGYGLNPSMFDDIISQAVRNQWTPEEFTAQLYNSDAFHQMFPGIFNADGSLKMSPAQWNQLAFGDGGYQDISRDFGIKLNRDKIGSLIEGNVSPDEWAFRGYVFEQAKSNDVFREAFNRVLKASGQQPLEKGEWFDFVAGKSNARIEDLYESASLSSPESGLDINAKQALEASKDIGLPGVAVDPQALVQQVQQIKDLIAPELRAAGITDAYLAVLQAGSDPQGKRSQLEQIVKNRQALTGGRIGAGLSGGAGGGLFPAQREGL